MTTTQMHIHQRAIAAAAKYKTSERELFEAISEVDKLEVYRELGFASLFAYLTKALGLSESWACTVIRVERKAQKIPELEQAILNGDLSIAQTKRIVGVLDTSGTVESSQTNKDWMDKAKNLTQRELEKRVVEVKPEEAVKDSMKFVQPTRVKLVCGISEELMKKIERIKDLVSQKRSVPATLEDAIHEMAKVYLSKHDPILKAERNTPPPQAPHSSPVATQQNQKRHPIPAAVRHEVNRRDRGRCQYVDKVHGPCQATRWLDMHHIRPVSQGGTNTAQNLKTMCKFHHSRWHDEKTPDLCQHRKAA